MEPVQRRPEPQPAPDAQREDEQTDMSVMDTLMETYNYTPEPALATATDSKKRSV